MWQRAHQLVLAVYRVTLGFPADEKYGLVSQMRRAAVSIPANIAEGLNAEVKLTKFDFTIPAKPRWKNSNITLFVTTHRLSQEKLN